MVVSRTADSMNFARGSRGTLHAFHWEFMFARPMFETDDMDEQGGLLDEVSKLVDEGALQNTATKSFEEISTDSLNEALTHQASGAAIGKTVLG